MFPKLCQILTLIEDIYKIRPENDPMQKRTCCNDFLTVFQIFFRIKILQSLMKANFKIISFEILEVLFIFF